MDTNTKILMKPYLFKIKMSGNPLSVDMFVYPQWIHFGSKNLAPFEIEAHNFVQNINTSIHLMSFPVNLRLLDYCTNKFSEKQVSPIGESPQVYLRIKISIKYAFSKRSIRSYLLGKEIFLRRCIK